MIKIFVWLSSSLIVTICAVKLPEYTKGIQLSSELSGEAVCRNSTVLECNDCRNIRVCDVKHKIVALIQCSGLTPYCKKDKCSAIPDEDNCSSDTLCPAPNRFFPNILNCKEYHFCSSKKMIIRYQCPAKYVYDQKTTFCKLPSPMNTCAEVDCKSSANRNQLIPYPSDPSIFVYCDGARNRSVLLVCEEGEQFEVETLSCEFSCQKEGHFVYKGDCRKYNACYSNGSNGFIKLVTECPPGMLFHPKTRVCDIKYKHCPSLHKRNITKEIIATNTVAGKLKPATEIITADEVAKKLNIPVIPVTDSKSIVEILTDLGKTVNISMDSKTAENFETQSDISHKEIDSTIVVGSARKTNKTRRHSRKILGFNSEQIGEMGNKSKPKAKVTIESKIGKGVASDSEKTTGSSIHLRVKKVEKKPKTKVPIGKEESKSKGLEKESTKIEGHFPTHLRTETGIGKKSNKTKTTKTNQGKIAEFENKEKIITTNPGSKKPITTENIEHELMATAGNEYIKYPMAEIMNGSRTIVEVAKEPIITEDVSVNSNKTAESLQTQARREITTTQFETRELSREKNNKIDEDEKLPNLNGQVATHPITITENETAINETGETTSITNPNTTTEIKDESKITEAIENIENEKSANTSESGNEITARNKYTSNTVQEIGEITEPKETVKIVNESEIATAPTTTVRTENELTEMTTIGTEQNTEMEINTKPVLINEVHAVEPEILEDIEEEPMRMEGIGREQMRIEEIATESNTTTENENELRLTKEVVKVPGAIEEVANEVLEIKGNVNESIEATETVEEPKVISEIVSEPKTTVGIGNESIVTETSEEIGAELKNVSKSGISSKIVADILTDSRATANIIANSLRTTIQTLNNEQENAPINSVKKEFYLQRSAKGKDKDKEMDLIRIFVDPRNLTSIVFTDVDVV